MRDSLYRKQYPVPQAVWSAVDSVIKRWFEVGKICIAPPNCRFNNPLVVAPKKDSDGKMTGIRVCLDTRTLNNALIVTDRFMIPNINTALEIFGGDVIFGEFDLQEEYLQFMLSE
jgi:hypothetical protein